MPARRDLLTGIVLVCLAAVPLAAQVDRASLNGTVTDPSGGSVPEAQVQAVAVSTGISHSAVTNKFGSYRLSALPVGFYAVTVAHAGFKTVQFDRVRLVVGETRTLDVKLEVGGAATQIEVKGAAPLLDRSSASLGAVVSSSQLQNLPVNGRNWASLLLLAPGAIDDGGGDQTSIRFGGRAIDDNNYTMDGVDSTGVQQQAQKSTARLQISEEAVSEYHVDSMLYDAEHGEGAGGQVDVVTKSGTNEFHGSLFEYFRNSVLDSRSPFDPDQIPPFRLNQFGGSFGGPIKKDRTFFFASYEGARQFQGRTLIGFVPQRPVSRSDSGHLTPACADRSGLPGGFGVRGPADRRIHPPRRYGGEGRQRLRPH